MLKSRIIKLISAVLILGTISPIASTNSAHATDTITKTFTIKKADGSLYVGALVQMYYYDGLSGAEVYTNPVTTNASGIAAITVPSGLNYLQYQVTPALGDVTNAVLTGNGDAVGENPVGNESAVLTLNPATKVVQLFQPDGTTESELNFSNICYPAADPNYGQTCSWKTRHGAFGIYLPSTLSGDYIIRVGGNTLQSNLNQFYWKYTLTASGTSGNRIFTLYSDSTKSTIYAPESNGVYKLVLRQGNLRVQLKDAGGNNVSVPTGVTAMYYMTYLNSAGFIDKTVQTSGNLTNGGIAPDGSFYARAQGTTAGKYQITISMNGSITVPNFLGYFWMDSSGRFSSTQSGTYAAGTPESPYQLNLVVPTANFKANFTKPGTSNPDSGYAYINNSKTKAMGLSLTINNGKLSAAVPDGTYSVSYYSDDPDIAQSDYTFTVTGGVGVLKNSSNTVIDPTAGIYALSGQTTNVKIVALDPTGTTIVPNVSVDIFNGADGSGGYATGVWTGMTHASARLANGTYQVVLNPWNTPYATQKYVLTVTSGVASVSGHAAVDGIISLPLRVANFKLKLVNESNVGANGWYEICQDTNQGPYQTGNCIGNGFGANGLASTAADQGKYYLKIHPQSTTQAVKIYSFTVDSSGALSISGASQIDGVWIVTGSTPNLYLEVTHPVTHDLISDGYINIEQIDLNGNYIAWLPNADLSPVNPGLTQTYVPDGKYLVKVNVFNGAPAVAGLASRTYNLDVSGGVATLTSGGTAVSKNGTRYSVSPASANVTVRLVDGSNSPIPGSWFDVCPDLGYGADKTGPCEGYGVDQNAEWGVNIPQGNWYIRVNPGSAYSLATKIYAATVNASGVATITGATKSGEVWVLPAATPNVSGSFTSGGSVLNFDPGQGISLSVQKFNVAGNYWEWQNGGQWRTSASYGVNVTAEGKYRLVAWPNGFSDLSMTYSNYFWVNGSGKLSTTGTDSWGNSLSNFDIAMNTPNVKFEVKNPIDDTLLKYGWVSVIKINPANQNQEWIGNADLNAQNPGLTGFYLADGTYRLEVNPQFGNTMISGLSRASYKAVVTTTAGVTDTVITGYNDTTPVAKDGIRFIINPAAANISGRVVSSSGNPLTFNPNSWINLNVQKLDINNNWQWTDNWFNIGTNGFFNVNVSSPGNYRLRIEPQGFQNATVTFSDPFEVTSENASTFKKDFGSINLNAPDLLVNVETSTGTTILTNIGIEVRQNDRWIDWAGTGNNGVAAISFADAGEYQLYVRPNSEQISTGSVAKSYTVTVTKNSSGVKTAIVTPGTGVSVSGDVTVLRLGEAALKGTVVEPETSNPVANAQVIAINSSGEELWKDSVSTSSNGKWAMSLPQGTYQIQARAPWGNGTFGNGEKIGTITVAADGTTSLSGSLNGLDKASLALSLKSPTWSGTVYDAGSNLIPYAQVCLTISSSWTCSTANALGQWALSAPSTFTSFDANAVLEIGDVQKRTYPSLRIEGADAVSAALGGLTHTGLTHHLPAPNVSITVNAGSHPAAGIWVNLEKTGGGWLGGNSTDENGVAKFALSASDLLAELRVRAEINGNPTYSTTYSSTTKIISAANPRSSISETVSLATPNIRGVLREPTVAGVVGAIVPNTWIELLKDNNNGGWDWVTGTGTDSQGQFALYAPPPASGTTTYIVRVNPPWNSASNSTAMQYNAVLDTAGRPTVTTRDVTPVKTVPTETRNGSQFYSFALAAPSAAGVVLSPSNAPIQNSWINPFDITNNQWMPGANSKLNGSFGLALPNGSYRLEANPPWNTPDVAKSSPCLVNVVGGAVANGGDCVQSDKSIQLKLHAPNLTFTLKSGTDIMAFANVGMGYGGWNTWAQSDATGKVSLYVDPVAIAQLNPGLSGTVNPYIWIDPPYGAANKMVRWDCVAGDTSKPLCGSVPAVTIGSVYPTTILGDIQVSKPNTVLHIKKPDGTSIGVGTWVNLMSFDQGSGANSRWYGGANTDSSGDAWFNVDSSTATTETRWGIDIYPAWDQRQTYAPKHIGTFEQAYDWNHGLTWSELMTQQLSPSSPNLVITVNTPSGSPVRYSWISIEELDPTSNLILNGKGGTGLDYYGKAAILLASNKRYRITAFPNGTTGSVTACVINTSSANPPVISTLSGGCDAGTFTSGTPTSTLTIVLDAGNVTGTVLDAAGTPVSGAVVVAMVGVDETTAVTTTTMDNGRFGLNLDLTRTWNVLIIPTGTTLKNSDRITVTSANAAIGTIRLANR